MKRFPKPRIQRGTLNPNKFYVTCSGCVSVEPANSEEDAKELLEKHIASSKHRKLYKLV